MEENPGSMSEPNLKEVPDGIWISRVEASHFLEGTCYVTFDGHRSDNFTPWVLKTDDFGKTWTSISNNLPDGHVVYVIREDRLNRNLLFLGTEFGLFISINSGDTWDRFMNNLPTVAVHDILIHTHYNDLIIGTHGRGIWICDDITPLQQLSESVLEDSAYLFDARTATQWHSISRGGSRGHLLFQGENPPRGALIHTYLGKDPQDAVLEISDLEDKNTFVIKLEGKPGINRTTWEFRFNPPELNKKEKEIFDKYVKATEWEERRTLGEELAKSLEDRGQKFAGINRRDNKLNPIPAEPGVYKITLKAGGQSMVKPLTVRKDPLLK